MAPRDKIEEVLYAQDMECMAVQQLYLYLLQNAGQTLDAVKLAQVLHRLIDSYPSEDDLLKKCLMLDTLQMLKQVCDNRGCNEAILAFCRIALE